MKYWDKADLYQDRNYERDYNDDYIDPSDEDRLDDLRMQEKEMEWANQFLKDNEGWGYND